MQSLGRILHSMCICEETDCLESDKRQPIPGFYSGALQKRINELIDMKSAQLTAKDISDKLLTSQHSYKEEKIEA